MITSSANSQIKNLSNLLKKGKARKEQEVYVIEGIKMFEEAAAHGLIQKAYITESCLEVLKKREVMIKRDYITTISYELITEEVLRAISDTVTPQGVIAVVKQRHDTLEDLLKGQKDNMQVAVLENVRDPGNIGTIIRTAEGAGMTAIIMNKECVDIYNPKVVRATMGSFYRIPIIITEQLNLAVEQMKQNGFVFYASHLSGNSFYDRVLYEKKSAIIIGNEANGITKETAELADFLIKIPMEGKLESLNAAMAAGIMMYEIYRQRRSIK